MAIQGQQHSQQMRALTEAFTTKMETIQTQITENADDIIDLRNENAELRKQVQTMQSDINFIQQQKLADRIEIAGVVESKEEDLKQTVISIAKAADVNLTTADVYMKKNGKICTKLITNEKVNLMVSGSFKTQLNNTLIGKTNKSNTMQGVKNSNNQLRIYINNAMTSLNQLLYKRLRDLKKITE